VKAAVIRKYGTANDLKIEEVAKPFAKNKEVLIEIYASSVNPIDWKLRSGMLRYIYPLSFPEILGFDVCGQIVEIGEGVTRYKKGDWVYARSDKKAGNAYAQYIALNEEVIALKPAQISPNEAAAMPLAALTAFQGMRDHGRLQSGQTVLINGASGGVGTYAVQIAKAMGATVVAVCGAKNSDLIKSLGADKIIDYKKSDPLGSDQKYPVIFDAVGNLGYLRAKRHLERGGRYVTTLPGVSVMVSTLAAKLGLPGRHGIFFSMKPDSAGLKQLSQWVQEGKLHTIIDSAFSLDDIKKAHERSESSRARGKIVIQVRST
jgi:NADPH:quinone reductase-like Zn-dependent oxidoreductase